MKPIFNKCWRVIYLTQRDREVRVRDSESSLLLVLSARACSTGAGPEPKRGAGNSVDTSRVGGTQWFSHYCLPGSALAGSFSCVWNSGTSPCDVGIFTCILNTELHACFIKFTCKNWVVFLLLSFVNVLHVLDVSALPNVQFINIFCNLWLVFQRT